MDDFTIINSATLSVESSATTSAAQGKEVKSVVLLSDVDCYISIGKAPVATTSDMLIPAYQQCGPFKVNKTGDKISALRKTSDGTLNIVGGQ